MLKNTLILKKTVFALSIHGRADGKNRGTSGCNPLASVRQQLTLAFDGVTERREFILKHQRTSWTHLYKPGSESRRM